MSHGYTRKAAAERPVRPWLGRFSDRLRSRKERLRDFWRTRENPACRPSSGHHRV